MQIQFRLLIIAGLAIDAIATLGLWGYIFKQGVSGFLLYGLAAAWVFAIMMMVFLLVLLMMQRAGTYNFAPSV